MRLHWVSFALLFVGLVPRSVLAQDDVRCDAPQILIVLDKSSSMNGLVPSGVTKWEAAQQAVLAVTQDFGDVVDFGLMVFPDPNQCSPGTVAVDCGPDTSRAIGNALGDPPPEFGNYTPMAQSIEAAGAHDQLADPDRRSYVLLITDGWQWCDPYDPATRFLPVDAVASLHDDRGLTTYVVGFGDSVDVGTLNRAAAAGGTAIPGCDPEGEDIATDDHCYYQTDDLDSLAEALDDIARHVTAEECDGFDNDCDFLVDEDFDRDEDGYTTCGGPGGAGADCDDNDPDVNVGAVEACDGIDNDCDGATDLGCDCLPGDSRACGTCDLGEQSCGRDGGWQECVDTPNPPSEACNGEDDDCDGDVDEGATCPEDGFACVDGTCVDLTPPDDGNDDPLPVPPPEPEPDAGPVVGTDRNIQGGCNCRTTPAADDAMLAALGALGLAVVVARRRRVR